VASMCSYKDDVILYRWVDISCGDWFIVLKSCCSGVCCPYWSCIEKEISKTGHSPPCQTPYLGLSQSTLLLYLSTTIFNHISLPTTLRVFSCTKSGYQGLPSMTRGDPCRPKTGGS
jgi:hypothetical protein